MADEVFFQLFLGLLAASLAHAECSPEAFFGPKPGVALVYEDGTVPGLCMRTIGANLDANGILTVVNESDIPAGIMPYSTTSSELMRKGYLQQTFLMKDCTIILKTQDTETTILDLAKDDWVTTISLHPGCMQGIPPSQCPPPIKAMAHCKIVSRDRTQFMGCVREIIEVELSVNTEQYGTARSRKLYFVSNLGIIQHELSQFTRIENDASADLQQIGSKPQLQIDE